ncbi:MAG: DUF4335 domain-containing protein [Chlorogloeopsis fritschii C42_A2020_084]|uniref:DUF4335 domain-containing protein n=1 Tax=Chlorogloeopsis fritschii TaxID=1124 RepID=UPI0019EB1AF0|nr:DUF4335 domain-containing protein [Chlorogloeopsis fritschii]MBF2006283.1 DUF4335 domain-containing protein [Chlorogloeopsis fritschii C42_A2020_084]
MNIQRKYSLPNCTLVLEGLSDATRTAQYQELRPALSILVNAECYLSGYRQPLSGGREFFESLTRTVSAYAQEFLSNVNHPQAHNFESELVQLQKIDVNRHRLIVHSEIPGQDLEVSSHNGKQPLQMDLNTVQLFDLVEAVDQFFADSQTLPELSLELQPVPRRYGSNNQALLKQTLPASVGATSLAAAAIAFGMIPPPEVRSPEPETQQQSSSSTNPSANTSEPVATTPSPFTNQPIAANSTSTPTPITAATKNLTPTPSPTAPNLEALLNTVPEITDASQLRALNRQIYNQINPTWKNRQALKQDAVFRVGVAADGAIVGYKAVNSESNQVVNQTPLPNLLENPANRTSITKEPIAQFKVVFTNEGVLQISPWRGYTKKPDVTGQKITDSNKIKELNQKLYSVVRQNWQGTPRYTRDLKYRVAINKDGIIADYEPLNQVAFDYFRETPLPRMFHSVYGSTVAAPNTKEPLAHFEVVFQPSGKLLVTPWQGYK